MKSRILNISLYRIYTGVSKKCIFRVSYKSASGVCFSEPARKMTQNGGRVVPIGSMFDIFIMGCSQDRRKKWHIESVVVPRLDAKGACLAASSLGCRASAHPTAPVNEPQSSSLWMCLSP